MKDLEQKKNLNNIELFCGDESQDNSCSFNYEIILDVFKTIGGKWELLIISLLINKPKRYGELKKAIPGISEKILSELLKKLHDAKILNRQVYNETPLKVEYSLTKLGFECTNLITSIYNFGEKLQNKIKVDAA